MLYLSSQIGRVSKDYIDYYIDIMLSNSARKDGNGQCQLIAKFLGGLTGNKYYAEGDKALVQSF